ncbi:MAG: hypothetical protein EXR45_04185 [Chloroflexi bacterium]|nr:hypothetical protein [Chloroflexota bacterium]
MGGKPGPRRSDGTEPALSSASESDAQLWLPRPGDARALTRLARLNAALEPSIFQSVDPPRASTETDFTAPVGPVAAVSPWIDDFVPVDELPEPDNILAAMWSNRERQGWFILSMVLLASLVALIGYSTAHPPPADLFGTVTGDRFVSTEMLTPRTSGTTSSTAPSLADISGLDIQASIPPADQGQVGRRSLPVALGFVWLLGAWIIDREARRALVIREPWGERRTLAYGMIAMVIVLPLMIAGIMIAAWGVVQALVEIRRVYGVQAAVRATGGFILTAVTILVLREPVARLMQWAAQVVLKPASSHLARKAMARPARDRALASRSAPWVPWRLRQVSSGTRWRR